MKELVILEADDGFHFLATCRFAETHVEAIDIENGIYTVYDADGMKLHLAAAANGGGVISVPSEREDCSAQLIPKLRRHFCRVGLPESTVLSLGFSELVHLGVERFLEGPPEPLSMTNAKWSSIVVVVLAWAILVAGWAWYYVKTVLAGPVYDDYANSVNFQLLMFAIFRLPIALILLGVAIIVVNRRSRTVTPQK